MCCLSAKTAEDEYLTTAKKYNADEMMHFSRAFAVLTIEMDNKGQGLKDCLGDYFMEILSNERKGQFFSPQTICDFMAEICDPVEHETLSDCCCGSGRMFIAAAKKNRNIIFHGADIDLQCCQMTLINLCLNGLQGVVSHMDSLRMEEWRRWEIKIHPHFLIPYIREVEVHQYEFEKTKISALPQAQRESVLISVHGNEQTVLNFDL